MKALLVLPVIVPAAAAAVSVVFWRMPAVQRWLAVSAAISLVPLSVALLNWVSGSGIQPLQLGNWPAPFGITLVADLFSAIMVVIAAVLGAAVAVFSIATIDSSREAFGYYPLFLVLLMGVNGALLTGDLFNLYVWFEVMLVASFVLMVLGGERPQIAGGLKYVTLNVMASAIFLAGTGLLYGTAGTLNMADLALRLGRLPDRGLVVIISMLFLVAFGTKAAIFPLFFWLPASYHTPPVAVSAVFAGLLTKVGVYALIRVFTLIFAEDGSLSRSLIVALAGFTMVTGVLGAIAQHEFRRILSFHIVSQIGYMIMGLGIFTAAGLAGSIFFIAHNMIVKTNLFLVSGVVHRFAGTFELDELGGLYRSRPWLGILFLVPALSLAGFPPLSGFFGKYLLVRAGFEGRDYTVSAVALIVSLFTLYSMNKIWVNAFWSKAPASVTPIVRRGPSRLLDRVALWAPCILLTGLTILIGILPGPALSLTRRAAEQLMHPGAYIEAVLGERR